MYGVTESMKSESLCASDRESDAIAVAPRVSLASMEAKIKFVNYYNHDLLTMCVLEMRNGFYVVGESAPASRDNYNAGLGRKFAYENAIRQLWKLEGYVLREQLFSEGK
jgi:Phage protein (N4 Gp49/phage Sf6 gene 66) family